MHPTQKTFSSLIIIIALILGPLPLIYQAEAVSETSETPTTEEVNQAMADLSIPFIENQGQAGDTTEVSYYVQTIAGTVFVGPDGLTYALPKSAVKEHFISNTTLSPKGEDEAVTRVSYFKGTQENWKSNLPSYNIINAGDIWPGINVSFKASHKNIEKIFTIAPHANPKDIHISIDGATLSIDKEEQLILHTTEGDLAMTKPVAYQDINGTRYDIKAKYSINNHTYGFTLGDYDHNYPLIIDPLIASTFVGGSGVDTGSSIVLDSSGNVYVLGVASDLTPVTAGTYDESFNGGQDVYVAKLNSSLTTLFAATFIGGPSFQDSPSYITLDSAGYVYITGGAGVGFPTTPGAYDETYNDTTDFDVFISKLNSDLTSLIASTYIGSSGNDIGNALTKDSSGNIYITGQAGGANFPIIAGAYDETQNGSNDVFVSKLNSALTTLSASTFIGGSASDIGRALIFDGTDNLLVSGSAAVGFPTTTGAYDESHNGGEDSFIAKFNSSLTTLAASTLLGGTGSDRSRGIGVDSLNNIYIVGSTSSGIPTTAGAYDESHNGSDDIYLAKFNPTLTALSAATYIGGTGAELPSALIINSSDDLYIIGLASAGFPSTSGAYDETHNGSFDAFISHLTLNLSATPTIQFTTTTGSALENVTTVNIIVSLDGQAALDASIDYTVSGGIAEGGGVDYTLANGTLTIPAGSTGGNIVVSLTDDNMFEDNETVGINLSNPTNAFLGTNTAHTLTITEDDNAPQKSSGSIPLPALLTSTTCFPGNPFSTTTSQPCTTTATGCGRGNLFSPITGKFCGNTNTTITTTLPGNFGYAFGTTIIKLGSTGAACKAWQNFFNSLTNANLVIDGKCGPLTMSAGRSWQASQGLVVDGLLGPLSRGKAVVQASTSTVGQ